MKTSPRIGLTMKNAKGINRERRLFFQAGTECDFTFELRRRSLRLAGDHAKANDEIERRRRGKDPRTVKAHLKTGLTQEHADVDRVARETVWSVFDNRRHRLIGFHPCACAQIASTKQPETTAQPERT